MGEDTCESGVDASLAESLVSATRTSLGDTLRSVVYFTPSAFDVLYVRSDLYDSRAAARERKSRLVEFERTGFEERPERSAIARSAARSDIGEYRFTVRFHENGFVVRVLGDGIGVLFTTDAMDVSAFREAVSAVRRLLGEN
jgi:hypothetical protein